MRNPITAAVVAIAVAMTLAGCSRATQQSAPEPKQSNIQNGTHTHVIQMPDGFRNVAVTCDGHNGIYVTSRGALNSTTSTSTPLPSGIAVVPNDPNCA